MTKASATQFTGPMFELFIAATAAKRFAVDFDDIDEWPHRMTSDARGKRN